MMAGADRFSLLLLEPGEIYFDDFSASLYTDPEGKGGAKKKAAAGGGGGASGRGGRRAAEGRRRGSSSYGDDENDGDGDEAEAAPVDGRVKICSKSLVFVPSGAENLRRPLIKFPLNECQELKGIV